jgi:hypothetical protein
MIFGLRLAPLPTAARAATFDAGFQRASHLSRRLPYWKHLTILGIDAEISDRPLRDLSGLLRGTSKGARTVEACQVSAKSSFR